MDNSFGSLSHGVVLLPELRTIHLELAKLMDEIDQLVREPILDEVRLASTRWKLSQARRQNRLLVDAILAGFPSSLKLQMDEAIISLKVRVNDALCATARHSGRWNSHAVHDDRDGYRLAIRDLRGLWMELIDIEQGLLYPLSDPRRAVAA